MSDYILCHHGVKGMRWGIRRTKAQLSKSGGKSKNETSTKDKQKTSAKQKAAKIAAKGAKVTAKTLNKVGKVYLTDQLFFGGTGTKLAKEAAVQTGRAAITAVVMARGGYDIKWYDKYGRRVG